MNYYYGYDSNSKTKKEAENDELGRSPSKLLTKDDWLMLLLKSTIDEKPRTDNGCCNWLNVYCLFVEKAKSVVSDDASRVGRRICSLHAVHGWYGGNVGHSLDLNGENEKLKRMKSAMHCNGANCCQNLDLILQETGISDRMKRKQTFWERIENC